MINNMRLGIYVGSFNPVHKGHIKVINYLLDNDLVDKVIVLPTPNYWDKQNIIDANQRIAMLKFYETDNIIIDDIHNNYQYTYEVLNSLKKDYPNVTLYLIIGSDNLEKLHLWKNINEILQNKIIVLRRGKTDISKYLEKFNKSKFIIIDDFDFIDISSSEIRNNLDKIDYDKIDSKVLRYIKENKLYQ